MPSWMKTPALGGKGGSSGAGERGWWARRDVAVVNVYERMGTGKWYIEIADPDSEKALKRDKITRRVLARGVPSKKEAMAIASEVFPQAEIQVAKY